MNFDLSAFKNGDEAQMKYIYEGHRTKFVFHFVKKDFIFENVEDAFQEAAYSVWKLRNRFDNETNIGIYLHKKMKYLLWDKFRSNQPSEEKVYSEMLKRSDFVPEDTYPEVHMVLACLDTLRRDDPVGAMYIEMFDLNGMSRKEIELETGQSRPVVYSGILKARRSLSNTVILRMAIDGLRLNKYKTIVHRGLKISSKTLPYEEAKKVVRDLCIKSLKEYQIRFKASTLGPGMPYDPSTTYVGYYDYHDYFGIKERPGVLNNTYNYTNAKHFFTYEQAVAYNKANGISDWRQYAEHRHPQSPSAPRSVFKNKWTTSAAFWGIDVPDFTINKMHLDGKKYMSFEDAIRYNKEHKIGSLPDYHKRKHPLCPSSPHIVYKDRFTTFTAFWGKKSQSSKTYISYEESVRYNQVNNINSMPDYHKRKHPNSPCHPQLVYKDEFITFIEYWGKKKSFAKKYVG